jgi:hypothetical protein
MTMTEPALRKLRRLLRVTAWLTAALALVTLLNAAQSRAQSPTDNKAQGIVGTWQGTLHAGRDLRTVVKISKGDGAERAATRGDQGARRCHGDRSCG